MRRWIVLAAGLGASYLCGRGGVAGPPLADPSGWRMWALDRPPDEAAVALVRLFALGAGSYALLIVTIALVGRIGGHRPTLDLAARLIPGGLRPVLALTATAALVTGISACGTGPTEAARPPPGPPGPPKLRWVGPAPGGQTPRRPSPSGTALRLRRIGAPASDTSPRLRRIGPATSGASSRPRRTGPDGRPPGPPVVPPVGSTHRGQGRRVEPVHRDGRRPLGRVRYVIRPGDSFWSIAAARVASRDAGEPADQQCVARYWRQLLRANLRDLPVPGQPDLLFPGDRISLPPVP